MNRFKRKLAQSYPSVQRRHSTRRCPLMTDTLRKRTRGGPPQPDKERPPKPYWGHHFDGEKGESFPLSFVPYLMGSKARICSQKLEIKGLQLEGKKENWFYLLLSYVKKITRNLQKYF